MFAEVLANALLVALLPPLVLFSVWLWGRIQIDRRSLRGQDGIVSEREVAPRYLDVTDALGIGDDYDGAFLADSLPASKAPSPSPPRRVEEDRYDDVEDVLEEMTLHGR